MAIRRDQRFTRSRPCPVCGGHGTSGKGFRCWGFLSGDGRFAPCTRAEYAGNLIQKRDGAYAHYLSGSCRFGIGHGFGKSACPPVSKEESTNSTRKRLLGWLNRLARESHSITVGDPVFLYFLRRGIEIDSCPDLRFHPGLPYSEDKSVLGCFPAMMAIVRNAQGHPVGFHRTYLSKEGEKAPVPFPRKLTPLVGSANAVQLSPPEDRLAIAEGIETALAFWTLSEIPTWACLSSVGIERFIPPAGVKEIVIAGDYDPAGIRAADILTKRLSAQEIEVNAVFPDGRGQDWNDVLREGEETLA